MDSEDPLAPLQKREKQLFFLIIEGTSEMGCAVRMGIKAKTVEQIRYKIRRKLGAKDLIEFAREHGLLNQPKSLEFPADFTA